jgi:hypothetical protein
MCVIKSLKKKINKKHISRNLHIFSDIDLILLDSDKIIENKISIDLYPKYWIYLVFIHIFT